VPVGTGAEETIVKPLTTAAAPEEAGAIELAAGATEVTVTKPLIETGDEPDEEVGGFEMAVAAEAKEVTVEKPLTDAGDEPDEEVGGFETAVAAVAAEETVEKPLTWATAGTEVAVEEEEEEEEEEDVVVEFEAEDGGGSLVEVLSFANVTVQAWTSITTGLPSESTLGVRVIVHVWVIGPTTVCEVCVV
jgi:hypothetical protein